MKLQTAATTGLTNKFKLLTLIDSEKQLDVVYDLGVRVRMVREHLERYDMTSIMQVVVPDPVDYQQPPVCRKFCCLNDTRK